MGMPQSHGSKASLSEVWLEFLTLLWLKLMGSNIDETNEILHSALLRTMVTMVMVP